MRLVDKHMAIGTATLVCLAENARKNKYNRQLSSEGIKSLDPDGSHILSYHFLHGHRAGSPCEEHVRTVWLSKMKGSVLPATIVIDIDMQTWERLEKSFSKNTSTIGE
tara:strand:+ start:428 stop:751 length:324 start_codon:yes stop_codon:yes gene_type:complete